MAQIVVSGDTSGSCTLIAPAVSGSTVLTLPTTSGTVGLELTGTSNGVFNNIHIGNGDGSFASNTVIGLNSFTANSTGTNDVVLGNGSMTASTTGYQCIAIGNGTLHDSTGYNNTALGYNALHLNTSGFFCVGLGAGAASSSITVSNEVSIYNGTVHARYQGAAAGWTFVSDARDKTNIQNLGLGLEFITKLQPRKFQWNLRHTDIDKGKEASGFIAQEVLAVIEASNAEYTGLVDTNNPDQYTFAVTNLIPVMVNAIKELTKRLEILEFKQTNGN